MPNVLVRTLSGALFVAVIVGCILFGMTTFCLLFVIVTALLLSEFNELLAEHNLAQVNSTVSIVSGVYLFVAFFCCCAGTAGPVMFAPYILSLIFVLVSGLYFKHDNAITDWAYTFAGQLYIALPMALLNVLAFNQIYSPVLPLAVFVMLWLNDTGAYCFGCTLGRKIRFQCSMSNVQLTDRLFPSISPKKSWVGSIGGGLVVLAGAFAFYTFTDHNSLLFWLGLGLTVCVFGTWGDLVESQFKRTVGIKDSGRLLPGHGGVLDRFDSSLLAIPAATAYVLLWGS